MTELITATDDKLVLRRTIPATREEVFRAWTDPDSISQWMCPGSIQTSEARLDVRVGGAFRISMKSPHGVYEHDGEYLVVDPPSKLAFTWISKGTDHTPSHVTIELIERDGQCELTLTHERLPSRKSVEQHSGGWRDILEKLAVMLPVRKSQSA